MEELLNTKIRDITQWLGTGSINIFGIQFSGKDTVGTELAKLLNASFLSSGDIMRSTFANDPSAHNKAVWEASKVGSLTGQLMPTDEFQHMIVERLSQPDLNNKPLVLSTVGRWNGEEKPVLETLDQYGHTTKAVLFLTITEDEVWQRWDTAKHSRNGGRHDDISAEKVARRLNEFKSKTLPVIDIYREMGLLVEINGMQPREKVLRDVVDALHNFSRASASR